jgi:hypothetical protein
MGTIDKKFVDRYADALSRLHIFGEVISYYESLLKDANQLIYEASKHTTNDSFYNRCLSWEEGYHNRRDNV